MVLLRDGFVWWGCAGLVGCFGSFSGDFFIKPSILSLTAGFVDTKQHLNPLHYDKMNIVLSTFSSGAHA